MGVRPILLDRCGGMGVEFAAVVVVDILNAPRRVIGAVEGQNDDHVATRGARSQKRHAIGAFYGRGHQRKIRRVVRPV